MRFRAARVIAVAFVAVIAAACNGTAASAPPSSAASVAAAEPSAEASAAPISSGSPVTGSNAAIVGEWVGVHDCDHIVSMLRTAKLDELIADAVVGNGLIPGVDTAEQLKDSAHPCVGAVQQRHSHFFTKDGRFGSKDFHASQVDDGTWTIEGDKLVIDDQPFDFKIAGDVLTLTPPKIDMASCTSKECRENAGWVLMVAMPGQTWTRGIITP
jgi:hypothetical protein